MPRRRFVLLLLPVAATAVAIAAMGSGGAAAQTPATTTTTPPTVTTAPPGVVLDPATGLPAARGPLVVVPTGCDAPEPAVAVFEAVLVDVSTDSADFRVGRILNGSLEGHERDRLVNVVFGHDVRYLTVGTHYVVGVRVDRSSGRLTSAVREPAPLFGGAAVVGRNDNSNTPCPTVPDPARTLLFDGSPVNTGVLAPLKAAKGDILRAVMVPVVVALIVLLLLAMAKQLLAAIGGSFRDLATPDPTPRTRRHGPVS